MRRTKEGFYLKNVPIALSEEDVPESWLLKLQRNSNNGVSILAYRKGSYKVLGTVFTLGKDIKLEV
jgi:hypothetical protein